MNPKILIVDDSKIVRAMIRKNLKMVGIEDNVFEAADGTQALEMLKEQPVDIVFADIHMPNMNGEALVEEIMQRDDLSAIFVVMISSDRSEARRQRLEQLGVKAYIQKPFRPEAFRDVLSGLVKE
jgi:two-component system chemotaxis response regulator CheY